MTIIKDIGDQAHVALSGRPVYVYAVRDRVRRALWRKACEYDGINGTARFVVFSPDNPFATQWKGGTWKP